MTAKPLDSVVIYDPKAHGYTVTLRRPTRADAEIAYLRAMRPELASQIERLSANFPELASRARKAGFLILAGKVTITPPAYTGREASSTPLDTNEIAAIEGSQVILEVTSNRPLAPSTGCCSRPHLQATPRTAAGSQAPPSSSASRRPAV